MRNFFNSSATLLALLILSSAVFAQTISTNSYYFPNFGAYKTGFGYSANAALQGQVFKSIGNATYEPYASLDLTLDGGSDFTLTTKTDENGVFSFDGVAAGNYTLFAQDGEVSFGSVAVTLSKSNVTPMLSENSTVFDAASMKLLFGNELFILGDKRLSDAVEEDVVVVDDACGMAAGGASCGTSACCGGGFGNMGMIAAGLGAAALAVALADDDNKPCKPVSVGTP